MAWPDAQREAVLAAASRLGLIQTAKPQLLRYTTTLILAGTTTGNRLRTELAAKLAADGVELGTIVALAIARVIALSEHRQAPESEPHKQEWENALHHLEKAFGPITAVSHEQGAREQQAGRTGAGAARTVLRFASSSQAHRGA